MQTNVPSGTFLAFLIGFADSFGSSFLFPGCLCIFGWNGPLRKEQTLWIDALVTCLSRGLTDGLLGRGSSLA